MMPNESIWYGFKLLRRREKNVIDFRPAIEIPNRKATRIIKRST